ncbi:MAG: sulfatase-like hydrolase/transferase [Verrucomicrobiales bacterium]
MMMRFLCGVFLMMVSVAAGERPNVLLILSDDQAWGDYGFMGHEAVETPALDKLAGESLTYTRGYVSSPLCRPSLASIFLGLPTHEHGITGNDFALPGGRKVPNNGRATPEFAPWHESLYARFGQNEGLAHLLGEAGYLSLQTGKWWEAEPSRFGFTHAMTHGDPRRGGRHGDEGLKVSREGIAPVRAFLDEAAKAKKPFFIWHAPFLPHTPHNPPADLFAKYRQRTESDHVARYWAMCEWFDQTCGELLGELDKRGLRENTVVIYVCDNGWIQREDARSYDKRSKRSPYEGGIRTPIMLRWPGGGVAAVKDEETLVSSTDIAPTILRACGLEVPGRMKGIDLRERERLAERGRIFGTAFDHDIAGPERTLENLHARYVVQGNWKLIDWAEGQAELYHLGKDPGERENLAELHRTKVTELRALLDAWWRPE